MCDRFSPITYKLCTYVRIYLHTYVATYVYTYLVLVYTQLNKACKVTNTTTKSIVSFNTNTRPLDL